MMVWVYIAASVLMYACIPNMRYIQTNRSLFYFIVGYLYPLPRIAGPAESVM